MNTRQYFSIIGLLLALLLAVGSAYGAQGAQNAGVSWQQLSRQEQQLLQRHQTQWQDYDAARQRKLQQGAHRYLQLRPEEQQRLDKRRREYEKMSPKERRHLRESYQRSKP